MNLLFLDIYVFLVHTPACTGKKLKVVQELYFYFTFEEFTQI